MMRGTAIGMAALAVALVAMSPAPARALNGSGESLVGPGAGVEAVEKRRRSSSRKPRKTRQTCWRTNRSTGRKFKIC